MNEAQKNREPLVPVEKEPKRDQVSAVDLCNRQLFNITLALVVADLFGCFLQKQVTQTGIPLTFTRADIPLICGIFLMAVGTFEFYKKFIEPFGEAASGSLHSLLGMLAMASLPILLFFEPLIPFRYLILSAYGIIVVIKNQQLKGKFRHMALGQYYVRWERQATVQTLAAFDGGLIYYCLIDPSRYQGLVDLIGCGPSSLPSMWKTVINIVCGSALFLVSATLFFVNSKDLLPKGDFQPELLARRDADSANAAQDGLLLLSELSGLVDRLYSYFYLIRIFSALNGALLLYLVVKLSGGASGHSVILASVATFLAIAAGFSLNDRLDIDEDRINNRSRPVAAGSISKRSALVVYCFCAIAAIVLGIFLSSALSTVVIILMLCLVSAYSTYLKRVWYLKNLTVAAAVTLISVLALTVASGRGSLILLVGGIFFWSLEKEILMDIRDIDGDQQVGITTFPIRTGRKAGAIAAVASNIAFWICLRQFLVKSVFGSTLLWIFVVILHTLLVWLIARPVSVRCVRRYLEIQIFVTTIALAMLLMQ